MNCYLPWNLKDMTNISAEKLQRNLSQQVAYLDLYKNELIKEAYRFNLASILKYASVHKASFGNDALSKKASDCLIVFLHAMALRKQAFFTPSDSENSVHSKGCRNLHRLMLENLKATLRYIDYSVLLKHALGQTDINQMFSLREELYRQVLPEETILDVCSKESINDSFFSIVDRENSTYEAFTGYDVQNICNLDSSVCELLSARCGSLEDFETSEYGILGSILDSLKTPFIKHAGRYYSFVTRFSLGYIHAKLEGLYPQGCEEVLEEEATEEEVAEDSLEETATGVVATELAAEVLPEAEEDAEEPEEEPNEVETEEELEADPEDLEEDFAEEELSEEDLTEEMKVAPEEPSDEEIPWDEDVEDEVYKDTVDEDDDLNDYELYEDDELLEEQLEEAEDAIEAEADASDDADAEAVDEDPYSGSLFDDAEEPEEEQVVEEAVVEEPATEEPVADEAVVEEPAVEAEIEAESIEEPAVEVEQVEPGVEPEPEPVIEEERVEEPASEVALGPEPSGETEPVAEPLLLLDAIAKSFTKENSLTSFVNQQSYEDRKEISNIIDSALQACVKDGRDKMFTIPETKISVVVFKSSRDPMLEMQRLQNVGAMMYLDQANSWEALELPVNEAGGMLPPTFTTITKNSFTDWQWKLVEKMGQRLLERRKK